MGPMAFETLERCGPLGGPAGMFYGRDGSGASEDLKLGVSLNDSCCLSAEVGVLSPMYLPLAVTCPKIHSEVALQR